MLEASIPVKNPAAEFIRDFFRQVPLDYCLNHHVIPRDFRNGKIILAVSDLSHFVPVDNIAQRMGIPVDVILEDKKTIENDLRKNLELSAKPLVELMEESGGSENERNIFAGEDVLIQDSSAPAVRLLNAILLDATQLHVTDVHFHPSRDDFSVMYRRDGMLHEGTRIPADVKDSILARLKVLSKLDVTQRHISQDGRFSFKTADREIEVRISVVPTLQGERAVLRFLDRENLLIHAHELGMEGEHYTLMKNLIEKPNGIILVTGPTGSGKTTTLYSFISEIDLGERNVMTIEDPVEYTISGITQMQVKPSIGLTFAQGLRSILRQDPDVILVGEIRDEQTAQIAVRAALTGHLVLSTLHTVDAPGALARLLDLGIEPYLLSSALLGLLSQRLVRKLCHYCGGQKCKECFQKGFLGRTGIFELALIDDDWRRLIHEKADLSRFRAIMKQKGIVDLRSWAQKMVENRITTEEEVLRVVG